MTIEMWTDVRAAITERAVRIDGIDIDLSPGCDAYTTIIQYVVATMAAPLAQRIWVTIREEIGVTRLVVDPHGRTHVVPTAAMS